MAAKACSDSAWWDDPWAKRILTHPKCTSAAKKFNSMAGKNAPTAALLAQLHVCIRHILAHKGMSVDVKKVIDGYPFSDPASLSQYLRRIAQRSPIFTLSSVAANATIPSTADSASSSAAEGTPASGSHSSLPSSAGNSTSSTASSMPVCALKEHLSLFCDANANSTVLGFVSVSQSCIQRCALDKLC